MISIIIRTKNEERWITPCLQSVFNQDHKDIEVIIVDNNSNDSTLKKAKNFDVKILNIDDFLPGKALNLGIKESKGEFIACLSAHSIPVDDKWLSNLLKNFEDPKVAGVYGRQEPMSHSNDFDKRDLLITFGLDKRVQIKDSFFHNANSMIRRDVWEKIPFDEHVKHIEDRIWAEEVLKKGYVIIYEPEGSVFHYHGIHQTRDPERCFNVVRILESLKPEEKIDFLDPGKLDIVALIPMKGEVKYLAERPLIEYAIEDAIKSKYVNRVIVLTDNEKVAEISKIAGAEIPFIRDKSYSADHVDLETVLSYSIKKLDELDILPDIVAILEPTFPFRPTGLIDDLIEQLLSKGLDTIIPGKPEYGSCWIEEDNSVSRVDGGDIPRTLKKPIHIGLKGLGCVTYPIYLREKRMFGGNVGILEVFDPYGSIEVRDEKDFNIANKLMEYWLEKNK